MSKPILLQTFYTESERERCEAKRVSWSVGVDLGKLRSRSWGTVSVVIMHCVCLSKPQKFNLKYYIFKKIQS